MNHQITNSVLMIRPVNFRMNEQTAVNNYFQKQDNYVDTKETNKQAQIEFDVLVEKLEKIGVQVIVVDDLKKQNTPDSIFPNNWISFHDNGTVGLYPMFAENRRKERREDVLDTIENNGFIIDKIVDYSSAEDEELFLEGTGSLILDRTNKKAYCALSARANEELFIEFCEDFEYDPIIFTANQTVNSVRKPIYHTNVMMCIAENFAIICLDSIDDNKEKKAILKSFKQDQKEVISITEEQMSQFAGNMIQLQGSDSKYLVMSTSAYKSLSDKQIASIEKYCKIMHSNVSTIEKNGGGSVRCMIAEIFLPIQK